MQRVLQTALTPTINMLSVAGLVSIPGMMTGQILAGGDAVTAAKYQIMIMFGIAAAGTCASIVAVGAAACTLTDESHRLRLDRLTDRGDELLYNLWCARRCRRACMHTWRSDFLLVSWIVNTTGATILLRLIPTTAAARASCVVRCHERGLSGSVVLLAG